MLLMCIFYFSLVRPAFAGGTPFISPNRAIRQSVDFGAFPAAAKTGRRIKINDFPPGDKLPASSEASSYPNP
jgi:hypothetical protein